MAWRLDAAGDALKRLLPLLLLALPAFGHVGTLTSFFDGSAGPYPVRVVVRPPGVVPGLADITIHTAPDVTRVAVKPVKWDLGNAGAPPPDVATRIGGEPNAWTASLWLMSRGSYSVYVDVDGPKGSGRAIVPVTSVATTRLPMPASLAIVMVIFGVLLVAGIISIAGAGSREAILPPGAEIDAHHRRLGRVAVAISAIVVALLVARGNAWWNEVDREYRKRMYKPFHVTTSVDRTGVLDLRIDDREWTKNGERWTPLMPDHGKLMHLFLIDEAKKSLLHLHPSQLARDHFQTSLPSAAPGAYRLFADITHESGFSQTLVDRVVLPPEMGLHDAALADPDDSIYPAPAPVATIAMEPQQLRANRDTDLRFTVRNADGNPAALEPYMGMLGHAVIVSDDFSVFVHLHPMGTISMASQQKFAERDRMAPAHDMASMSAPDGIVSFPFAFPKRGKYWLFVQVKMGGRVVTERFEANVA